MLGLATAAALLGTVRTVSPGSASWGEEEVRGKGRGIEDFLRGSNRPAFPGGLKLILEKGILLVFRAFD